MTELAVGTKKGLFVLEGDPGAPFEVAHRVFAGEPVEYATRDPRTGRLFAAVSSPIYGPKVWFADDAGADWTLCEGFTLPAGGDQALERVWLIVPGEDDGLLYAGGDPGVLFESRDNGETWTLNDGLWNEPSRPTWQPGGGGLCLHSIVPWPGDSDRLTVAISAAGVWHTEDGGKSWTRGNTGIVPRYLPEDTSPDEVALCVHHLERAPRDPQRLFMQFHGGVYRSDDGGRSWNDIAAGLPSDFGFPLAVDPTDPDAAYVIPLSADTDRVTPDGRVRVYETRDAGATWTPRGEGLPQESAYLTVLRLAFDRAGGNGDGATELYFGATSGDVFGSGDAGSTWFEVARRLPPVYSVSATIA
jgi:photosystem II stability/assembly factor-like uncharacterized protein